ncbi:hypothetical protein ACLBXB_08805 [Methylobacterium mesophilicum]
MFAKRQQAVQILFALTYGASHSARDRLEADVPSFFITRIKRLLEIDLKWARANPELLPRFGLAFYDQLPLGTGHEVQYSPFRVFTLAVALELVRFGAKQGEAVDFIAQIQGDLKGIFDKANHARQTFGRSNATQPASETPETSLREKLDALKIYLVLRCVEVTPRGAKHLGGSVAVGERLYDRRLLEGQLELEGYVATELRDGLFSLFVVELAELAVRIVELIQVTPSRNRGHQPPRSSLSEPTQPSLSEPPSNWGEVMAQFRVRDRSNDR